jgi:hypothetical protein
MGKSEILYTSRTAGERYTSAVVVDECRPESETGG